MDPSGVENLQSVYEWTWAMKGQAMGGLALLGLLAWMYGKVRWLFKAVFFQSLAGIVLAMLIPPDKIREYTADVSDWFGLGASVMAVLAFILMAVSFRAKDGALSSHGVKVIAGLLGGPAMMASWVFSQVVAQDLPQFGFDALDLFFNMFRGLAEQLPDDVPSS